MRNFPEPSSLKILQSFLGLASYYRCFILRFLATASPLHALTWKEVPFVWTRPCREALEQLKELLVQALVLAFPHFSRQFILEIDALGEGLGAVLGQKDDDGAIQADTAVTQEDLWGH